MSEWRRGTGGTGWVTGEDLGSPNLPPDPGYLGMRSPVREDWGWPCEIVLRGPWSQDQDTAAGPERLRGQPSMGQLKLEVRRGRRSSSGVLAHPPQADPRLPLPTPRWLYEGLSREKAEELLLLPGNRGGAFLIRESQTRRGG